MSNLFGNENKLVISPSCVRNKITFDAYVMRSPEVIVYTMASFLVYWAGMDNEADAGRLKEGANKLMKMTADLTRGTRREEGRGGILMIDGA